LIVEFADANGLLLFVRKEPGLELLGEVGIVLLPRADLDLLLSSPIVLAALISINNSSSL
jgi:hypothetical protein